MDIGRKGREIWRVGEQEESDIRRKRKWKSEIEGKQIILRKKAKKEKWNPKIEGKQVILRRKAKKY